MGDGAIPVPACPRAAVLGGTVYRCWSHAGGSHHFASRWPACPAAWCRAEPGHREPHDIPPGTPLMADDLTAELTAIRDREQARDVPRLVAALEAALKPHRRSLNPAWGNGSGGCHGKHFCMGCSIDGIYREWPCQPYQDITRELLGEAVTNG